MKLGFVVTRTLDQDEWDALVVIGEAIAKTKHDIWLSTNGNTAALAKGLIAGKKAPHTISKGILDECDTVVMYTDEDWLTKIDQRNKWGTAHVIVMTTKTQLTTFMEACLANAEQITY